MRRTRVVPAAPAKSASATWSAIANLIADALEPSPNVNASEVESALKAASGVGRGLISGGHLDRSPIVLVAPPIYVSITTVSGPEALRTEEPASIPGGASVADWTIYLPTPNPLESVVASAASSHDRLSAEVPPADTDSEKAAASIDRSALEQRLRQGA